MRQSRIKFQQCSALSERLFFRAVGQKAEVTDAHEALGQDVKQKAADEFVGIEGHRLFSIPIFAISVTQGDLAVLDFDDTVIGESDAVGVAAEVVENFLRRTERLFRVDDPALFPQGFGFMCCDFSSIDVLL